MSHYIKVKYIIRYTINYLFKYAELNQTQLAKVVLFLFFNKLPLKQITKWNVPKTFKLSKHAKIERVIIIHDYYDYLMLRNETGLNVNHFTLLVSFDFCPV